MLKINKDALQNISFTRGYKTFNSLSVKLDVPHSTFNNYLNGKRYLPEDLATKISNLLNCPIEDFTTNHTPFDYDFTEYWALRKELYKAVDQLTEEQMKLYLALMNNTIKLNEKIEEVYCTTVEDDYDI